MRAFGEPLQQQSGKWPTLSRAINIVGCPLNTEACAVFCPRLPTCLLRVERRTYEHCINHVDYSICPFYVTLEDSRLLVNQGMVLICGVSRMLIALKICQVA